MTERGSACKDLSCTDSSFFMRRRSRGQFFPEVAVNVPRNEEDATKYCNARTRSARRRRVIVGSWPRNWRI